MKKIVLDGKKMTSVEETHAYIKEKLTLPDYYGMNLDALWDLLSVDSKHKNISLINHEALASNLGDYAESLIKVFVDASDSNNSIEFMQKD